MTENRKSRLPHRIAEMTPHPGQCDWKPRQEGVYRRDMASSIIRDLPMENRRHAARACRWPPTPGGTQPFGIITTGCDRFGPVGDIDTFSTPGV